PAGARDLDRATGECCHGVSSPVGIRAWPLAGVSSQQPRMLPGSWLGACELLADGFAGLLLGPLAMALFAERAQVPETVVAVVADVIDLGREPGADAFELQRAAPAGAADADAEHESAD